jgi:hypothetical protein
MGGQMISDQAIDAFVSYNKDDWEQVFFICNQLRIRGNLKIFIDTDITYGENWLTTISNKLHYAETFLLFIRKPPTRWQLEELQVAVKKQVETTRPFIIPVLLPNMERGAFFDNPSLSFINRSQAAQFLSRLEELETIDGLKRAIEGNSRVYISNRAIPRSDNLPAGFKADVGKITDILIGESLYASKNICIRELVQNARDACSRRRQSIKHMDVPPQIVIVVDRENRFFDIIDEGEGMTRHNLAESFSVLGASINDEYRGVFSKFQHMDSPITGKFGIGFVSTFMVADRIAVSTETQSDGAIHFEINTTTSI